MNPGGIRADLTFASSEPGEPPGEVTYEEAFTVQPFNNYLVSMNLTGADIYDLLTQQVTGANASDRHKDAPGFRGLHLPAPLNGPVDGTVELNGPPIDKAASPTGS